MNKLLSILSVGSQMIWLPTLLFMGGVANSAPEAKQSFLKINNVSIVTEIDVQTYPERKQTKNIQCKSHFYASDDRFLFNYEQNPPTHPYKYLIASAFDGSFFQKMNHGGCLYLTKNASLLTEDIISGRTAFWEAYRFLKFEKNYFIRPSLDRISDHPVWETIEAQLNNRDKLPSADIMENPEHEVVIDNVTDRDTGISGDMKVQFDVMDTGVWPKSWELVDKKNPDTRLLFKVSKWTDVVDSKGDVFRYPQSALRLYKQGDSTVNICKFTTVSCSINDPNFQETFSIDLSLAKSVFDLDKNMLITVPK
ncbi:MAG: hypothetical protein HC904_16240 [Blastochloris sp.]|nr:hypothetical protein [Blastochloris sp.]